MEIDNLMKNENLKLKIERRHNLLHHAGMIIYSEIVNLAWFLAGVVLTVGGLAIFKFAQGEFFKLAVGLPIILIGVSVGLFKFHEIILVIARPKRLKAMCIFCQKDFNK